jgi:hypothetical protein
MSRKTKTLIAALGVLVLLSCAYYWSKAWNKKKTNPAPPPHAPSVSLGNLEISSLVKIEVNGLVLEKSNDAWRLVSLEGKIPPEGIELDQTQIQFMTYSLASVHAEQIVDDAPSVSDLSKYGLDKPSCRVSVADTAGREAEYLLGDMTPSRVSYYIMETGDPKVYAVSSHTAEYMQITLDNIRRRLLFPPFDLSALTLLRAESSRLKRVEISPLPETYKPELASLFATHLVTSPYALSRGTNSEALGKLLIPFMNLEIADFIDDAPPSLKPYGLDDPLRIFLQTEDASIDLLIGNEIDGKRYAKLAGAQGVFTLGGMEGVASIKPFTLIDKFALLINIENVGHLSISGGEKNLSADFRGEGDDRLYYLNGAEAEPGSFKTFYQAVIGLIIDAEYPGPAGQSENAGELAIEYRLNTPPGERISFTLIPYNRDFYAIRQGGAAEFLISRSQVRHIYETADAVTYN